jgi:hypothetical protein
VEWTNLGPAGSSCLLLKLFVFCLFHQRDISEHEKDIELKKRGGSSYSWKHSWQYEF